MKDTKTQEIAVGTGATLRCGSDCYPYTVVEVASSRRIFITADSYRRADTAGPYTENQAYIYETNWDAPRAELTLRKNGRWFQVGQPMTWYGGYSIGNRRAYQDPCF